MKSKINKSEYIDNFEKKRNRILNEENHKFDPSVDPIVHLKSYFQTKDFKPPKKMIKPPKKIVYVDKNTDVVSKINSGANPYDINNFGSSINPE